jgi:pSer/pThr/pTyr-binding forkhead associated (FHA) protein
MARDKAASGSDSTPRDWSQESTLTLGRDTQLPTPAAMASMTRSDPLAPGLQVIVRDIASGQILAESDNSTLMIGRADGVADVLIDDDLVSRYHACVIHRGGRFFLADMGSTNGTELNGELVGEAEIQNGDRICVGETVLEFATRQG